MSTLNYRTINIDALDPDSPQNFPIESLLPSTLPPSQGPSDAANTATQVRQLLRSGDPAAALIHVLDTAPLGGDEGAKQVHLATVIDVLQGIRQSEMGRVLAAVLEGQGGVERGDCLMKYLYKGMAAGGPSNGAQSPRKSVSPQSTGFSQIQARNLGEGGGGQQMSVLLNWHEKLVELAGTGSIVRVMTDRRTV
ncbi:actin-related protein 2/3 complex subunit 5 family protein [Aspergillus mulundensis]|uniref:Actin-related protein 2/3 complex subunit 5 n=1 Tax=Aspergillus mulundensis TaxID=1810919 RepID=A0A3D8SJ58_9EURO|nr:Actin-related protein 2 complex subunit 5 [Aspergillus mulundensis]RDW86357.1 Actin-related protein 2 complex subunit 5 [Aspergillus mulundensis]